MLMMLSFPWWWNGTLNVFLGNTWESHGIWCLKARWKILEYPLSPWKRREEEWLLSYLMIRPITHVGYLGQFSKAMKCGHRNRRHILVMLTHWGRVTHICVGNLTIIGSDNGLSPGRRQAIIWTNAVILSIGPLGTNFSEILIKIITFSFKKMRSKVSSGKRRPSCLGLNVLKRACRCIVARLVLAHDTAHSISPFQRLSNGVTLRFYIV